MNTATFFTLVLLALTLIACESPVWEQGPEPEAMLSPVVDASPAYPLGSLNTSNSDVLKGKSEQALEARRRLVGEIVDATRVASRTLYSDASLEEKDRAVREALAQPLSEEAVWLAEQQLALDMLEQLLQAPEADPALVGFYVERLVARRNPNADLVLAGLARVQGHWSADQMAAAARQSREAALDYLEDQCPRCAQAPPENVRLGERAEAILGALDGLKQIAG